MAHTQKPRDLGDGLRIVGLVMGLILLAYFFIPSMGPVTRWTWDMMKPMNLPNFMLYLYPIIAGGILIIFTFIPIPAIPRGAIYGAIGLFPFIYIAFTAPNTILPLAKAMSARGAVMGEVIKSEFGWRSAILFGSVFVLPFSLFLRARRWNSIAARILILASVVGLLCIYLIPFGKAMQLGGANSIPAVAFFSTMKGASGVTILMRIYLLFPLLIALLSLLSLGKKHSPGGGNLWGTLYFLWMPLGLIIYLAIIARSGANTAQVVDLLKLSSYFFVCQLLAIIGLVFMFPPYQKSTQFDTSHAISRKKRPS